jgi:hypothetical protein
MIISHLTNDLQAELNKIGSNVRLLNNTHSSIKLNYKDWAWADINSRQIQASTFVGLKDKHLQLEEKGIIACTTSTKDIKEIAVIIDKWLDKLEEISVLAKEYADIEINERYWNLKTLSVSEVLIIRWAKLSQEIEKGRITFRKDVFQKLRENFSFLFPIFSHDNLSFSNILELSNDDFKSPSIFCDNDQIWVGFYNDNSESEANRTFKTKDIQEAISKIEQLLPVDRQDTFNPLTT